MSTTLATLTAGQTIEGADKLTIVGFGSHSQSGGPDVKTVTIEVVRNETPPAPAE
jgi:hypothetical protein